MSNPIIRIATRSSPLARWQAEHVAQRLEQASPTLKTTLVTMLTKGDKILDAPLAKIGGKGLFVKELEQGILDGRADIAVHSLKDLPAELPAGLHLSAILSRADPSDALVSNHHTSLQNLPANARIGTSSLRRQCQIKAQFPTVEIVPLRGNVHTRLAKLDAGQYDAIILATAGLQRLGMAHRITQRLATTTSLPAIGQGIIGIECRQDDALTNDLLSVLHDPETALVATAERAMNARLQGGCQVPIAGFAEIQDEQVVLHGLVGAPDGSVLYRAIGTGNLSQAAAVGVSVADDLLAQGAAKILQALY